MKMRSCSVTGMKRLTLSLLLTWVISTGVWCFGDSAFVYSREKGQVLLPCSSSSSSSVPIDCSSISWTFYIGTQVHVSQEVQQGRVSSSSRKSGRLSLSPNCSLVLEEVRVEDAGSYDCVRDGEVVTNVYLSVLVLTSTSSVTHLRLGGTLALSCVLFTYYDAGSCISSTRTFTLSWTSGDGTQLHQDHRYELIEKSRCNVTLITRLQRGDDGRRWRCQVRTREQVVAAHVDFAPTFPLDAPERGPDVSVSRECGVQVPVSRIVLCAALPVMVLTVGLFTWRGNRKRGRKFHRSLEVKEFN